MLGNIKNKYDRTTKTITSQLNKTNSSRLKVKKLIVLNAFISFVKHTLAIFTFYSHLKFTTFELFEACDVDKEEEFLF